MSKKWFKAALVRAIKTVAQTAIATIGSSAVIEAVDWKVVLSASVLAGLLSILTSVAGLPEVNVESRDNIELKDDNVSEADEYKATKEIEGVDDDE